MVGGDAVVLADGQGKVRGLQSAASGPVGGSTTPQVSAAKAEKTARTKLAGVDKVESPGWSSGSRTAPAAGSPGRPC